MTRYAVLASSRDRDSGTKVWNVKGWRSRILTSKRYVDLDVDVGSEFDAAAVSRKLSVRDSTNLEEGEGPPPPPPTPFSRTRSFRGAHENMFITALAGFPLAPLEEDWS